MWTMSYWIPWRNRDPTYPGMVLQEELSLSGDCDTRGNCVRGQQVSATLQVVSGSFGEDLVSSTYGQVVEEHVQTRSGEAGRSWMNPMQRG